MNINFVTFLFIYLFIYLFFYNFLEALKLSKIKSRDGLWGKNVDQTPVTCMKTSIKLMTETNALISFWRRTKLESFLPGFRLPSRKSVWVYCYGHFSFFPLIHNLASKRK